MFRWLSHQRRLNDLEERVASCERVLKEQQLDRDALWEKLVMISNKIARRIKQDRMDALTDNTPGEESNGADAIAGSAGPMTPLFSKLTPRQKQIQMSVLARRQQKAG